MRTTARTRATDISGAGCSAGCCSGYGRTKTENHFACSPQKHRAASEHGERRAKRDCIHGRRSSQRDGASGAMAAGWPERGGAPGWSRPAAHIRRPEKSKRSGAVEGWRGGERASRATGPTDGLAPEDRGPSPTGLIKRAGSERERAARAVGGSGGKRGRYATTRGHRFSGGSPRRVRHQANERITFLLPSEGDGSTTSDRLRSSSSTRAAWREACRRAGWVRARERESDGGVAHDVCLAAGAPAPEASARDARRGRGVRGRRGRLRAKGRSGGSVRGFGGREDARRARRA